MATEGSQEQRWLIEKLFGQSVCGEARLQTEFAFGTNMLSFFFFSFFWQNCVRNVRNKGLMYNLDIIACVRVRSFSVSLKVSSLTSIIQK